MTKAWKQMYNKTGEMYSKALEKLVIIENEIKLLRKKVISYEKMVTKSGDELLNRNETISKLEKQVAEFDASDEINEIANLKAQVRTLKLTLRETDEECVEYRMKAKTFEDLFVKNNIEVNDLLVAYKELDEKYKLLQREHRETDEMFEQSTDDIKLEKALTDRDEQDRDIYGVELKAYKRMVTLIELLHTKDE